MEVRKRSNRPRHAAIAALVGIALSFISFLSLVSTQNTELVAGIVDLPAFTVVDPEGGQASSIAVDSNNEVHISYYHATSGNTGELRYATNAGGTWTVQTVDRGYDGPTPIVGEQSSIAVDDKNKVHIAYYDSNRYALKYATNSNGYWYNETVEQGAEGHCSIAVTPGDCNPNIAYLYHHSYTGKYELRWASFYAGTWQITVVDEGWNQVEDRVGYYPSIAIDSVSRMHVSYGGYDGELKYATNSDGTLRNYTIYQYSYDVFMQPPRYTSIAIDRQNKVHITSTHPEYDTIRYDSNSRGSWAGLQTLSNARYSTIDLDSQQNVYVCSAGGSGYDIRLQTYDGAAWKTCEVDNSGRLFGPRMVIGTDDRVHISCTDSPSHALMYGTFYLPISFVPHPIDSSGAVGEFSSIAIDSNDNVHISYCEYINYLTSNLKYATNFGGYWTNQTIDDVGGRIGYWTSIAVDSNDKVHISYQDGTNGDVRYATNAGGSWATVTVDSDGFVGQGSSIAVDSNNKVHIAYYDNADGRHDLKYATNAGGSWAVVTIDSGGDVGQYSSIAVDSADNIHITYFDVTSLDVKYATNRGGSWTTSTIVGDGNVGWTTSLAIDGGDRLHVSYYDATNTALGYATNSSGSWQSYIVDNDGEVGGDSSLAADSWGWIHIVYRDLTNGDLKYAENVKKGSSWGIRVVDSAGDVGSWASVACDSIDYRHVSYYDSSNMDLKYVVINVPVSGYPYSEIPEFPSIAIPVLGAMLIALVTPTRNRRRLS